MEFMHTTKLYAALGTDIQRQGVIFSDKDLDSQTTNRLPPFNTIFNRESSP
jgi:hypothetical protein